MNDSRQHILNLIRDALGSERGACGNGLVSERSDCASTSAGLAAQPPASEAAPTPSTDHDALVKLFAERVRDYGAAVTYLDQASVGEALRAACIRQAPSAWRSRLAFRTRGVRAGST